MRHLFPSLLREIRSKRDFKEIHDYLLATYRRLQEWHGERPKNQLLVVEDLIDYDEWAADLVARRWQFDFESFRSVNIHQLVNIDSQFLRKHAYQPRMLHEALLKLRDRYKERTFLRMDVYINFKVFR